jgi:hypothetical protein
MEPSLIFSLTTCGFYFVYMSLYNFIFMFHFNCFFIFYFCFYFYFTHGFLNPNMVLNFPLPMYVLFLFYRGFTILGTFHIGTLSSSFPKQELSKSRLYHGVYISLFYSRNYHQQISYYLVRDIVIILFSQISSRIDLFYFYF